MPGAAKKFIQRVKIRRRRSQDHEHVHIERAAAQCAPRTAIKIKSRSELHDRRQNELRNARQHRPPACKRANHADHQRQGENECDEQTPFRRSHLRPRIFPSGIGDMRTVTAFFNFGNDIGGGYRLLIVHQPSAAGNQIDRHFLHSRHSSDNFFDSRGTGRAMHAGNGKS